MAIVAAMSAGLAGFWAGDRVRTSVPPIVVNVPPPPAPAPTLPVLKKARAAVLDVPARSPWLHTGDHVDIVGVFVDPQTNEQVAVTLVQNVIVSGTTMLEKVERLTVLLLPEEAELVLLAQRLGTADVTLRHPDDVDVLEERGRATINTLLSGERSRILHQKRFNTVGCILRGGNAP
jgi:pilus assembly protein CpaB